MSTFHNEILHGYVLHSRPYREKSRLLQFYSLEHGRIDGIIRQIPPPLYQSCVAMANGKSSLKNFTQVEPVGGIQTLEGSSLIAGFYLNELLVKLLPLGDASATIFAAYVTAISELSVLRSSPQVFSRSKESLILILRKFEYQLLDALGYGIRFDQDILHQPIFANFYYSYAVGEGFIANQSQKGELGSTLLAMSDSTTAFSSVTLPMLSRVFRVSLAVLLGNKPLKSRELWVGYRK